MHSSSDLAIWRQSVFVSAGCPFMTRSHRGMIGSFARKREPLLGKPSLQAWPSQADREAVHPTAVGRSEAEGETTRRLARQNSSLLQTHRFPFERSSNRCQAPPSHVTTPPTKEPELNQQPEAIKKTLAKCRSIPPDLLDLNHRQKQSLGPQRFGALLFKINTLHKTSQ
jgi:hypothetical protein